MQPIPWQLKRRLEPKIAKWAKEADQIAGYPAPFNGVDGGSFFLSRVRDELCRWAGVPVSASLEYEPRRHGYFIRFSAAGSEYEYKIDTSWVV